MTVSTKLLYTLLFGVGCWGTLLLFNLTIKMFKQLLQFLNPHLLSKQHSDTFHALKKLIYGVFVVLTVLLILTIWLDYLVLP